MTVSRYYSSSVGALTLQAAIGPSDTSISVDSVVGLPTSYPYTLVLDYGGSSEEVVDVSNATGTTLTISRGKDGTVAQAHDSGAVVRHSVTARDHRESREHEAATAAHGVTEVVGADETQTLDAKTFEPSGDNVALTIKTKSANTEPALEVLDDGDDTQLRLSSSGVEAMYGGTGYFTISIGTAISFYKRVVGLLLSSDIHGLAATKVSGATGKFLRLLATDGTTETFSVDADGDVAAQDVAVAGTLSGPTVTSLQAADTALDGRVDTLEGREIQSGTATIPFAGTSTESVDVTFPSTFSGTPTVVATALNVGINVSVASPSSTGVSIYGRRIEDGATQGSSVSVAWIAFYE